MFCITFSLPDVSKKVRVSALVLSSAQLPALLLMHTSSSVNASLHMGVSCPPEDLNNVLDMNLVKLTEINLALLFISLLCRRNRGKEPTVYWHEQWGSLLHI